METGIADKVAHNIAAAKLAKIIAVPRDASQIVRPLAAEAIAATFFLGIVPPRWQWEPVPSRRRWHGESAASARGENDKMTRRATSNGNGHTVSEDIASIEREIGGLMQDIEARVGRLQALARRSAKEAAEGATEFVSDTVSDVADRARNGAHAASEEAARLSGDAIRRIEDEVGQRPLLTLAIAAGIGFLAGMAGRRR